MCLYRINTAVARNTYSLMGPIFHTKLTDGDMKFQTNKTQIIVVECMFSGLFHHVDDS